MSESPPTPELPLRRVTEALVAASTGPNSLLGRNPGGKEHPSLATVAEIIKALRAVFFPGYFGVSELTITSVSYHVGATLDRVARALQEQIRRGLSFKCDDHGAEQCGTCSARAGEVTRAFIERLPEVRRLLGTDIQAAYDGDPATPSLDEAIFCNPGVLAIMNHRIAHELHLLEVPLIPRMISEQAHSDTGIDIHPGARIGEHFFIDHGTGVVIGETTVIGQRVRIYQGVTLGAKSFPVGDDGRPIKGIDRHPIVEDDVIIYSGATILGRIIIGQGSVIGGNIWLTRAVGPGSRVTQAQARHKVFESGDGI